MGISMVVWYIKVVYNGFVWGKVGKMLVSLLNSSSFVNAQSLSLFQLLSYVYWRVFPQYR